MNRSAYHAEVLDLVLLRHGQSSWNAKNLFTGWVDVDLTEEGKAEAVAGGQLLAAEPGLDLRILHTSVLTRAIHTAELALNAAGRSWLPVHRDWRLNERHYGDLQGKNKKETTAEFGEEKVKVWRRSYDTPPPPIAADNPYAVADDPRYRDLDPTLIPADRMPGRRGRPSRPLLGVGHPARTYARWLRLVGPCWWRRTATASGPFASTWRASRMTTSPDLEIPTGIPYRMLLNDDLTISSMKPLGDPEAAAAAAAAVARQAG